MRKSSCFSIIAHICLKDLYKFAFGLIEIDLKIAKTLTFSCLQPTNAPSIGDIDNSMDPFKESLARAGPSDSKSLQSLLKVTEELLFSFPLPTDIVKKYEFMRESAFAKLGLPHSFSRIWNLQREAHSRSRTDKANSAAQTSAPAEPAELRDSLLRAYRKTLESVLIDLDSFLETVKLIVGVPKERGTPLFISELETYARPRRTLSEDQSESQQLKHLQNEVSTRVHSFDDLCSEIKKAITLKDLQIGNIEAKTADNLRTISRLTAQYEEKIRTLEQSHEAEKADLEVSMSKTQEQHIVIQDQSFNEAHRNYLQEIEALLRERDKARDDYRLLQVEFDRTRASLKVDLDQVHGVYKQEMELLSQNLSNEIERMKKTHYNQIEELKTAFERKRFEEENTQSSKYRSEYSQLKQEMSDTEQTAYKAMETIAELQKRVAALYLRRTNGWKDQWRAVEPEIRAGLRRQLDQHMANNHFDVFLQLEFLSFVLDKHADKVEELETNLATEQQERRILEIRMNSREPKKMSERFREVQEDMDYAAGVLRDFEAARARLVGQFPAG